MCGTKQKFYNQYMDEKGQWTSDSGAKPLCTEDKTEILEYCRKVYPKHDITNIVESSHFFKVERWCKFGTDKCKWSHWIKPYRCLEGPFQSDALLVPEHCLFDHVHNQSKCLGFDEWNRTAAKSCSKRDMKIRSFAMLLPCGIGVFSGVEFVCCPMDQPSKMTKLSKPVVKDTVDVSIEEPGNKFTKLKPSRKQIKLDSELKNNKALLSESDKDYDDDNDSSYEDDDDSDEDEKSSTTTSTTTTSSSGSKKKELSATFISTLGNGNDRFDLDSTKKKSFKKSNRLGAKKDSLSAFDEDDDDENSSDYDDDDEDSEEEDDKIIDQDKRLQDIFATSPPPTPDPYFSHYDAKHEHDDFKAAGDRFENRHKGKITKVMKDWSELEEKYQDMKSMDPKEAEKFKKTMTSRFQKTVAALEEEGAAEKRQLMSMHQQRVLANINEKKREGMECLTHSLNANNIKPSKVQKCMEKLFRALEKDRQHTVNHFKHLLNTNYDQAVRDKQLTADHLYGLDRTINQSLDMLDKYPEITTSLKSDMLDYLASVRTVDVPATDIIGITRDEELQLLDRYQSEVYAKQQERNKQKKLMKQQKEEQLAKKKEYLEEKKKVIANLKGQKLNRKFDPETMEDERLPEDIVAQEKQEPETHAAVAHENVHDIKVAHVQAHDFHHNEASYSIKKSPIEWQRRHRRAGSSMYITVAFAGVALLTAMVVGVAFIRRRSNRLPHGQGFVQVDSVTPEERHVNNMQSNGYENPTYKYFESRE